MSGGWRLSSSEKTSIRNPASGQAKRILHHQESTAGNCSIRETLNNLEVCVLQSNIGGRIGLF